MPANLLCPRVCDLITNGSTRAIADIDHSGNDGTVPCVAHFESKQQAKIAIFYL
jgi:hypothetical protein